MSTEQVKKNNSLILKIYLRDTILQSDQTALIKIIKIILLKLTIKIVISTLKSFGFRT